MTPNAPTTNDRERLAFELAVAYVRGKASTGDNNWPKADQAMRMLVDYSDALIAELSRPELAKGEM